MLEWESEPPAFINTASLFILPMPVQSSMGTFIL